MFLEGIAITFQIDLEVFLRFVPPQRSIRRYDIMLGTVLLIVLILLLVGAFPAWPHSRGWGYAPSGILGTVLIILVILFLLGKL